MKNILLLLASGLALSGCGTINSTFREDAATSRTLSERGSHCGQVPRVYGGVMYDFCVLHAPIDDQQTGDAAQFVLLDMAASGALDTLLLPYTLLRQQRDGSIAISRER
jgi:uncharacterized protein YceK